MSVGATLPPHKAPVWEVERLARPFASLLDDRSIVYLEAGLVEIGA